MWSYCYIFYTITQIYVLSKSDVYTDQWFVRLNTVNDLIRDLRRHTGEKIYISVDLTYGLLTTRSADSKPVPILASSFNYTDLTLETFLRTIIATKALKNAVIKFNILEEEVLEPAINILKSKKQLLPFDIWIHANILRGSSVPQNSTTIDNIIDPTKFFEILDKFDKSVNVSLGWAQIHNKYEWKDVHALANIIRCLNMYHPINVDFKITLALKSIRQIRWLLGVIPLSSADLYQSDNDDGLYLETLVETSLALANHNLYYSLIPGSDDVEKFRQIVSAKPIRSNSSVNNNNYDWIIRPDRLQSSPASCILSPYINPNTLLINSGETTFLIMNERFHVPTSFSAKMTIIDSVSRNDLSYYVTTFSVFAIKSQKMPSNLEDVMTEKLWSALRHHYTKKLDHHSEGDDDVNSTYYFRLSVGDNKCSYISKTELDVTRDNKVCKNKQTLSGEYIIFVIMHDGWSSIVLEDIKFTGSTLNLANGLNWSVSGILIIFAIISPILIKNIIT